MHRFFEPAFTVLHTIVVEELAREHPVGVVPLLGVNRHFRQLAVERLVQAYKECKVLGYDEESGYPKLSGQFVKFAESGVNPYDGPFKENDPRYTLVEQDPDGRAVMLVFNSHDPKTTLVTLKPVHPADAIYYDLLCDDKYSEWPDLPRIFEGVASGWFKKARPGRGVKGLELAFDDERYPPIEALLSPEIPNKRDGEIQNVEQPLRNGWTICYSASRMDSLLDEAREFDPTMGEMPDGFLVPAQLKIHWLKIPLVSLFIPRHSTTKICWYD
ncbi:hypothetical protein JCM10049v2_002114 [Rhodotorula toruloides]